MDDEQHGQELRQIHLRRLHVLEEQAETWGKASVPPHIVIEIEDLRAAIAEIDKQLGMAGKESSAHHPVHQFPPIWNIPHLQNLNFTGREELLMTLHAALTSGRPAAIYGLGGVGKTQLTVEYAYRHAADYTLVWWIRSEEPTSLTADYVQLASELNLLEKEVSDQAAVVAAVHRWLEHHSGWLLIFDNANELTDLQPYLPRTSSGNVLITSRNPSWGSIATPLSVPVLPLGDAVTFLLNRTRQSDRAAAAELAKVLGYLPLAMAQAGAYIESSDQTLAGYLTLFTTHRATLLARGQPTDYPATVATTWELAFRGARRKSRAAGDLLYLCAFLAPENISLDMVRGSAGHLPQPLATTVADRLKLDEAIATLRRYSLLERKGETLAVHRIVQTIARDWLSVKDRRTWASAAIKIVNHAYPSYRPEAGIRRTRAQLLPHAMTVTEHTEALGAAPDDTRRLLFEVSQELKGQMKFAEARTLLKRALAITESTYGPNHPEVAFYLCYLGSYFRNLEDYKGAQVHYERALAIYETTYGPDHPDVAFALDQLGKNCQGLGDLESAKTHHERALAIYETTYGPDHPNVAPHHNNLGLVLHNLRDLEGAKIHYERALAIEHATLRPDHPDTAPTLSNLGTVLQDLGDLEGAKTYLERALVIGEAAFGPNDSDLIHTLNNLGWLLQDLGDLEGAKTYLKRALGIAQHFAGENHRYTTIIRDNLRAIEQQLNTNDETATEPSNNM